MNLRYASTLFIFLLTLTACSTTPVTTPEPDDPPPMPEMGRAGLDSLEAKTGEPFDIAYMSQLIEHHMGAIEVAGEAQKEVERQEVKDASATVISSQADEIATLTGWLRTWYDTNPDAYERGLVTKDSALSIQYAKAAIQRSVPDRAFLERIIPHHRRAIEMSQLALEKATRPELREFAQEVIDMQNAEIEQYTAWLQAWYGVGAP
jgi:uncharacterized protein (DUF305 family)